MATATINSASITKNQANGVMAVGYTVEFSPFDQLTNLTYKATVSVAGDDSLDAVDDEVTPSVTGLPATIRVRSNGRATVDRQFETEFPWVELDEDPWWNTSGGQDDEEIRITVTMTPQLPQEKTAESDIITLDEIEP
ncbi:MAG: hypothetical protein ACR2QK_05005 [Acidimicrobiales bacterium]